MQWIQFKIISIEDYYQFLYFIIYIFSNIFPNIKIYIHIEPLSYLPTPPLGQDMTQGQFFKQSLTGLISEFSFSKTSCLTKAEEPSLPYYLPIAGGRIIGFIPFPRVLVLCEMQSVSSRIWIRVTVSISCDNNHYTTGTSILNHYGYVYTDLIMIGWLFYGISTLVGYLMPNPVYIICKQVVCR